MRSWDALILTMVSGEMLLSALGAGRAMGQEIHYNGSVQFATGSYYFTEQTESFYFNNGLSISGKNVSVYVNLPLISQNTPWISYTSTGIGPLPTGGPHNDIVDGHHNQQGSGIRGGRHRMDPGSTDTVNYTKTDFGDPSLSGNITLYEAGFGKTRISGNFGLKLPIADPNSGFGTGAWDVGGGLSWSQRVANNYLLLLSGTYWYLGDMDALNFNNILSYSAAMGRSFSSGKLMATANFFGSTEIIDGIDPPLSVGAGLNFQASSQINLNVNTLAGLTESAADFGVGLGWSIKL